MAKQKYCSERLRMFAGIRRTTTNIRERSQRNIFLGTENLTHSRSNFADVFFVSRRNFACNKFISARQVQSGIAIFKLAKADEIREYFKYLATLGCVITRGADDALEIYCE